MSSLREKQRQRREQAILDAAGQLFSKHGYSPVNVEDIAELAEVGVATIYKYFGAKSGLIRELWRPEIKNLKDAGERVLANPPADPAHAMAELISQYRFGDKWQHRDLYQTIAGLNLGYAEIFEGLRESLDDIMLSQIQRMLKHFIKAGLSPGDLNVKDVSHILFAIHEYHLQRWATHEDVSLEKTRKALRRRILLAFRAWTN